MDPGRSLIATRGIAAVFAVVVLILYGALDGRLPWLGHFEWIGAATRETSQAYTAALSSPDLNEDGQKLEAFLFEQNQAARSDLAGAACILIGPALAMGPDWPCAPYWHRLGPPHQLHDRIRQQGGGAYSVWHGTLYFSTPDGGDPSRGRRFALWVPWTEAASWLAAAATLGLAWALWPWARARLRLVAALFGLSAAGAAASIGGTVAGLAWAGLLLAAAQLLPYRPTSRPARAPIWALALAGFVAADALLGVACTSLGLTPRLQTMQMLKYLVERQTDRPILLLVGSSLTQYDIDEAELEQALEAAGHPMTVLRLGFGGMSAPERLYYIRRYLAAARHRPALVWFEISAYYDLWPLKQLEQNRYSTRAVAAMDAATLRLSLDWALGPDAPPTERWGLAADLIGHFALHVSQAGFLANSVWPDQLAADAFAGTPPKTKHFVDADIAADLAATDGARTLSADLLAPGAALPQTIPSAWARRALGKQIDLFRRAGAISFGFYAPPARMPDEGAYARLFCRARPGEPCLIASDPTLLAALGHDEAWLDETHLQGPGRRRYTDWLAAQLAASGTLP
jgi:hypothetical protein